MLHDEMIAVIEHHKNGGEVEYKMHGCANWLKARDPEWDFSNFAYRIKQPAKTKKKFWRAFYLERDGSIIRSNWYPSKDRLFQNKYLFLEGKENIIEWESREFEVPEG